MKSFAETISMLQDIKKIEFIGAISGIASLFLSIFNNSDSQYISIARESTLVICLLFFAWVMEKEKIREIKEKIEQKYLYESRLKNQKDELIWWSNNFKELNDSFLNFAIWNHDITPAIPGQGIIC